MFYLVHKFKKPMCFASSVFTFAVFMSLCNNGWEVQTNSLIT